MVLTIRTLIHLRNSKLKYLKDLQAVISLLERIKAILFSKTNHDLIVRKRQNITLELLQAFLLFENENYHTASLKTLEIKITYDTGIKNRNSLNRKSNFRNFDKN